MSVPHTFRDPALLERALTHPSAGPVNNQRLEFLGDRVVNLVVCEWLMERHGEWPEGQLSRARGRLVSAVALARFADAWELGAALRVGRGSTTELAGQSNVRADVFEAVIAAIYLDAGLDAARVALVPLLGPAMDAIVTLIDPRTQLLEWAQKHAHPAPVFTVTATEGPPHATIFTMEVVVNGQSFGPATGSSKRVASAAAAALALVGMGITSA